MSHRDALDLVFIDDAPAALPAVAPAVRSDPWRVLIVDDDEDVHDATALALRGVDIQGRRLAFLHARNAAEARDVLRSVADLAVVLLDVVMEAPDAGLQLVGFIRNELGLRDTRVILRTGQPGYAPELSAIREYDINDYRTKSELTHNRLVTAMIAAIRSYEQIRAIETGRRGLDLIMRATPDILARQGLHGFANEVLVQFAALLGVAADGLVCGQQRGDVLPVDATIVAGAGRHASLSGQSLAQLEQPLRAIVEQALAGQQTMVTDNAVVLPFSDRGGAALAVCVDLGGRRDRVSQRLLDVFRSNVAVCLENLRLVEQLREHAYVDPVVGLPNRVGLIEELRRRAAGSERERLTLALVDIDSFAAINSAFGHAYGDALLRAFAQRLVRGLGTSCYLARVSNDTFAVLGDHEQADPQRIRAAVNGGVTVDGQRQSLAVTLGLLRLADVSGRDGGGTDSGADLLKDASIALKRAKQECRGQERYYTPKMGVEIRERMRLLDDLRNAVDRERLFVVYQPQVDLATGRPVGAEALLRWRNDEGKFVPPDRFIPLAEYSGLIIGLGAWVMRNACHLQRRIHDAGFAGFRVAVNLSVAQFRDPRLIDRIGEAVRDSRIDPRCLELEITESVAMTGETRLVETFAVLRGLGLQLAIDDFGTGYSSLAYLQRMRVDRLKIDRSFIAQLGREHRAGTIAEMVVQLGRTLGLRVIAEGVEDENQAAELRALGCHEAQGYHFARPMDPDALLAWLGEQARDDSTCGDERRGA